MSVDVPLAVTVVINERYDRTQVLRFALASLVIASVVRKSDFASERHE
jgi:hypothetical protein